MILYGASINTRGWAPTSCSEFLCFGPARLDLVRTKVPFVKVELRGHSADECDEVECVDLLAIAACPTRLLECNGDPSGPGVSGPAVTYCRSRRVGEG